MSTTSAEYTQRQLDQGKLTTGDVVALVESYQRLHGLEVDGKPGPKTLAALRPEQPGPYLSDPSPLGLVAVAVAMEDLSAGKGEEGGNNSGAYVEHTLMGKHYDGDPDDDGAWCAYAVAHWVRTGAERVGADNPLATPKHPDGRHGLARTVWKMARAAGRPVDLDKESPAPGDVICWSRGTKGWQGHVGLVCEVSPDGLDLATIEGNTGGFPSVVVRKFHGGFRDARRLLGVARLPMGLVEVVKGD